ncbi:MAG: FISUMP domain-containing protein, partial [Fibrobacterota bacterium]
VQIPSLSKASGAGAIQVSFQVAPRADVNGRVNIKLVAKDASDSAVGTFQLQVAPRNDPSVFTVTKIVPPINGTALVTVSGWATGISSGPKDEAAQKTTFEVVAADQADILVGIPSIDSAGTLRVQARPGVSGAAKFRARLVDNGDSSGANQNKGQWQDFVVTVNAAPTLILPVRSFSLWQNSVLSFGAIALQDDETSAGNLTLKRTSSNNSLLPPDSVYLSGTGASRKVTLHPVSDRTGSCTLYFQVADSMGGSKTDSILVVVKGVNHAPSFTLSSTSVQLQNYNRDSLLVRIVGAETTNDTAQYILERRVDLIGSPLNSVLSSKPTLDAQGTLHLPRLPNPRGWFTFRITIKDNGGTENGGIDSVTKDLKIFFSDTIIDEFDGNVYHYAELGNRAWFTDNLRRTPKWGTVSSDSTGLLYHWAQAMDLDSSECNYADCSSKTPWAWQGLCPVGWNVPDSMEWQNLINWAGNGQGDSIAVKRLKSRSGWTWTYGVGSILNSPGTDDWGFNAKPNTVGYPTPSWGAARYWARDPNPTEDGTWGRMFADLQSQNSFSLWGLGAPRYVANNSVRCVKTVAPGQW